MHTHHTLRGTLCLAALLAIGGATAALATGAYQLTDLGSLGTGYADSSYGTAVNSAGQVTGTTAVGSPDSNPPQRAFVWDAVHGMQELGALGGSSSSGIAINESGQVAGNADILLDGNGYGHAFIWDRATGMHDLGTLNTGISSHATGLNNAGQVVGTTNTDGFNGGAPFLWDAAHGMQDISASGLSQPKAINNQGLVLGSGPNGPALWDSVLGGVQSLGAPSLRGFSLNDHAQVAGDVLVFTPGFFVPSSTAAVWDSVNGLQQIGTLTKEQLGLPDADGVESHATAINNLGQVTGYGQALRAFGFFLAPYGAPHPFVWDPVHGLQDLSGAATGISGGPANGISANGKITGQLATAFGGHAFLLAAESTGDTAPPVTTATLTGPLGGGGWYTGALQVTLSATDDSSGVAATYYTLDAGGQQVYSGPFSLSGDGNHVLTYWSVDAAGNAETPHVTARKIDSKAPVVTAAADLAELTPPNGKLIPVTVTGTIKDSGSGVNPATAKFAVTDSYGTTQPNGAVTLTAGSYSFKVLLPADLAAAAKVNRTFVIAVSANDVAGNQGSASVTVSVLAPGSKGKGNGKP